MLQVVAVSDTFMLEDIKREVLREGNCGDLIHDGNTVRGDANNAKCRMMKIKVVWRVRR
jgi:hypothetical protein